MDFKGKGIEHWKVLSATMVCLQENVLNYRGSRMAKSIILRSWRQPFNIKTSFFLCFTFLFCYSKKLGGAYLPPPTGSPLLPALFCQQISFSQSFLLNEFQINKLIWYLTLLVDDWLLPLILQFFVLMVVNVSALIRLVFCMLSIHNAKRNQGSDNNLGIPTIICVHLHF